MEIYPLWVELFFFLKLLIGPDFTNDINLSRCELPQKVSSFFFFSDTFSFPFPVLALFCSELEQGQDSLNIAFFWLG